MKKLVLLFGVFGLLLSSCSNDDDNSSSQDLLIGSWKLHKIYENDVEVALDPCEKEGTIVVSANGAYSATTFEENLNGGCEPTDVENGTWENVGNGNYTLTFEGFSSTEQLFFEDNTFYFLYSDTFNGETTEYKDVYIRN